jgi:hypothetical protein
LDALNKVDLAGLIWLILSQRLKYHYAL